MKKPKLGGAVVLFLIMGVIIPLVFVWAFSKGMILGDEYSDEGKPVKATVISVTRVGSTSDVMVKYKDDDGQWVEAKCIANKKVMAGNTLEGYVMPDDPYNVYCPPDNGLRILFFALFGGVALGGWAVLISALKDKSRYDKLMKNGTPCRALLTSWHDGQGGIEAQFRIFRRSGEEQIISVTARQGRPQVGEYYDIVFAELPDGKVLAELTDERLR